MENNCLSDFRIINLSIGCSVDQFKLNEDKSTQTVKEVKSNENCQMLCDSEPLCYVWTFHGGACYLKGENTILYPQKRVSGISPCKNSSELMINAKLKCLLRLE